MSLVTTNNKTGEIVQPGDELTDFRGDTATFVRATRAGDHRSGKVLVRWGNGKGHGATRDWEYYDNVFDLRVTEEA